MVTAVGVMESSHIRVCRFGDNMNNVAVTEGDKVEAQIKFGWKIDHYNVNDLVEYVDAVPAGDISALTDEYYSKYHDPYGRQGCSRIQKACRSTGCD